MFTDLTEVQEWTECEVEGIIGFPLVNDHIVRINFDERQCEILPVWTGPMPQ
jgi:hypothetical protein